jgi:hypothetical protein
VIDGAGATRVLHVQGSAPATGTVRLERLTVTGGNATTGPGGGAILVDSGSLTLVDAVLHHNEVTVADGLASNGGGAIYNRGRDTSLQGSSVSDNSVTVPGSTECCHGGGGIYSNGTGAVAVNASSVVRNTVKVTGPGADGSACCSGGGGIYQNANDDVTITGSNVDGNSVTLDGADRFHGGGALYVDPASAVAVDILGSTMIGNKVTVTGPAADDDAHCCSGGGAVFTLAGINVVGSVLNGNSATVTAGSFGHGGGAVNIRPSVSVPVTASFASSTLAQNTATVTSSGAVQFNAGDHPLTFDRSLLAGNAAKISGSTLSGGGAVYEDGAHDNGYVNTTITGNSTNAANPQQGGGGLYLLNAGPVSTLLANVTLAGNSAPAGSGGGVLSFGNTLESKNSIVAQNSAATGADCAGFTNLNPTPAVFTSLGHNLESAPGTCGFTATGDRVVAATAVKLGPLKNNGGPTQTRALLAGSPALDGGNPAGCTNLAGAPLTTDQRGRPRPLDATGDLIAVCDIGAYEAPARRPHCTLEVKTRRVPRTKHPKLRLRARCDERVTGRLGGTIKIEREGKKGKTVKLRAVKRLLKRNVARTIKLAVPKSARSALYDGARESARFTLRATNVNGRAKATARIKKLKLAKP